MHQEHIVITLKNSDHEGGDLLTNREFKQNLQTSLLLALLEQKKLTQSQFDQCQKFLF